MRQVVVGPDRVSPRFQDFVRHHAFEAKRCRPYRPRTKGKVERSVAYLRDSFLNGRTFDGLDDLNAGRGQRTESPQHVRERWTLSMPDTPKPPPKGCHIAFVLTVQVRPLSAYAEAAS
jgi:transposase